MNLSKVMTATAATIPLAPGTTEATTLTTTTSLDPFFTRARRKYTNMRTIPLAFLGLLALSGLAHGSEILVNGNFETGTISPWTNNSTYDPTGTGWSITSSNCFSGTYCVTDMGNVGLMQTFAGVAVANITDVSFYQMTLLTLPGTAVDFYYQGQGVREVVVPGVPSTGGWDFFDATSYLLPNYTLVGFEVYGIGNSVGTNGITTTNPVQYDNLSITTNTATPEPGTLALFGCGLFGIIWIRRRRA